MNTSPRGVQPNIGCIAYLTKVYRPLDAFSVTQLETRATIRHAGSPMPLCLHPNAHDLNHVLGGDEGWLVGKMRKGTRRIACVHSLWVGICAHRARPTAQPSCAPHKEENGRVAVF